MAHWRHCRNLRCLLAIAAGAALLSLFVGCKEEPPETTTPIPVAAPAEPAPTAAPDVNGTVETLGEGASELTLVHLWGTPYEMGEAHGTLLAAEVQDFLEKIVGAMTQGMGVTEEDLDQAWAAMEPCVAEEYMQELEGLAAGSGVDLQLLKRAHAIPDISEMDCTFFAAWGDFTAEGNFIQLRALDYATEAHIQDNPAIIVYHPEDGPTYVNVGWCGFIGMVTGMNAEGVCMSEIGDDFDEANHTIEGQPMPFMMRDVVRKATTMEEGVKIVEEGKGTSSFLFLIGDGKLPGATAIKKSATVFETFTNEDTPYGPLGDVVWMSMGADSDWNGKIGEALKTQSGELTVESATEGVTSGCETGDLHTVYFDATNLKLWVANADVDESPGYDEGFVEFDFGAATDIPE